MPEKKRKHPVKLQRIPQRKLQAKGPQMRRRRKQLVEAEQRIRIQQMEPEQKRQLQLMETVMPGTPEMPEPEQEMKRIPVPVVKLAAMPDLIQALMQVLTQVLMPDPMQVPTILTHQQEATRVDLSRAVIIPETAVKTEVLMQELLQHR